MAVLVPTTNWKKDEGTYSEFETYYITPPNEDYRPISTGETSYISSKSVTYTQSDYTGGEEGVSPRE